MPVEELRDEYFLEVQAVALKSKRSDMLVLILVGHGDPSTGSSVVGEEEMQSTLRKKLLERAVTGTKGSTRLVILEAGKAHIGPFWQLLDHMTKLHRLLPLVLGNVAAGFSLTP